MSDKGLLLEEEQDFKKQYKWSRWWVTHRDALRRLGIVLFIVFDSLLLLFVGWTFFDAFALSYEEEQRSVAEMVAYGQSDLHAYSVVSAARDLLVEDTRIFSIGSGRYDFYTTITNQNQNWWATFDYRFVTDSGEPESYQGFILPGEEKPIVQLAFDSEDPITDAQLVVENLKWIRLDKHDIKDYESWYANRMDVEISGQAFTKEEGFDGKIVGRSSFSAKNNTGFSYYDPKFYILLKRGSAVVGVNRTTISSFDASKTVDIDVNWFGVLPSSNKVEIIPEIHLLDPSAYKDPDQAPSFDRRN